MAGTDTDREIIDRAAARAHEAVDRVSGNVKNIDEQVRERAHRAERQMEDALSDVQQHSQDMVRNATECVRDHPWMSVGLAVGAGMLLNAILRRR